jgi:hypothetical protein
MDEGVEEIPLGLYLVKGDMMYVKHVRFSLLAIGRLLFLRVFLEFFFWQNPYWRARRGY